MPNYAYSKIYITGKKETLLEIKEILSNRYEIKNGVCIEHKEYKEFDFNKINPYPEEFQKDMTVEERKESLTKLLTEEGLSVEEIKRQVLRIRDNVSTDEGFNNGGYEWCCRHWGTKWNATIKGKVKLNDKRLFYEIETAWSPPYPIFEKLSKMFPEVKIRVVSTVEGYDGSDEVIFKNGEKIDD